MSDRSAPEAAPLEADASEGVIEQKDAKSAKEGGEQEAGDGGQQADGETEGRSDGVIEPKDAKGAKEEAAQPTAPDVVAAHVEQEKLAERIRQSELLPVGLRTRLAELVSATDSAAAEQAVRAVEEALPGALRLAVGEVGRPQHPAGDVFFRGDAGALSEEHAEALARGQLARSGLLRGQRARVAPD